jgi:hypothetical protein
MKCLFFNVLNETEFVLDFFFVVTSLCTIKKFSKLVGTVFDKIAKFLIFVVFSLEMHPFVRTICAPITMVNQKRVMTGFDF